MLCSAPIAHRFHVCVHPDFVDELAIGRAQVAQRSVVAGKDYLHLAGRRSPAARGGGSDGSLTSLVEARYAQESRLVGGYPRN